MTWRQHLPAIGVAVVLVGVYLATLAPTITWRNDGSDSGELAAAVATLGVAHPPGYPTYVIIGWLWTRLPFGDDLAFRLNLFSAFSAALASGVMVETIRRLVGAGHTGVGAVVGAMYAGLALGLAPFVWSQAVITEVYAPGLVLVVGLLAATLAPAPRPLWLGALIGVGSGLAPLVVLFAPGIALVGVAGGRPRQVLRQWRTSLWFLARVAIGAAIGGTVFALIPLRAGSAVDANWGLADTAPRLFDLVTAAEYRPYFTAATLDDRLARVGDGMVKVAGALGPVGLSACVIGFGHLWARRRSFAGLLVLSAALTVVFRANYPAHGSDAYLAPALACLVAPAGVGVGAMTNWATQRLGRVGATLVTLALGGFLAFSLATTWPTVDARADWRADAAAKATLAAAPPGAIVVTEEEALTFPLWYRQAVGDRRDVVVIDRNLLARAWYQLALARRNPDLNPAALRPGGLTALGRSVYRATLPDPYGPPVMTLVFQP